MCTPQWKEEAIRLRLELQVANAQIVELQKVVDIPDLKPCGMIDINLASSILLDKLDEIGDDKAEIFLPDDAIKIYNKEEVKKSHALQEVSSLTFIKEWNDCDDFAAKLYGEFAGLVWTNVHALNWFFDEDTKFWWIEPQNRKISDTLEAWQGSEVRFFIGR